MERARVKGARGLTAISTRIDPRFPKPAIVGAERGCADILGADGEGSRNGYVLPESGIRPSL